MKNNANTLYIKSLLALAGLVLCAGAMAETTTNAADTSTNVSQTIENPAVEPVVITAVELEKPVAVSYTHLDVYKRQKLNLSVMLR